MANELTTKEKQIIRQLKHPPYSVDFCEEWLNRPKYDVITNAPCALQQLAVENFIDIVRRIANGGLQRRNEGYIIEDSIHVGDTEFVLAKLDNTIEMYVTWQVKDGDYYFWGHYFTKRSDAERDLAERALEEHKRQEALRPSTQPGE